MKTPICVSFCKSKLETWQQLKDSDLQQISFVALRFCRFTASLKAVALLEPSKCNINGVHIVRDGIFVFCDLLPSNDVLCYQFEKQPPFDLMSLILSFGRPFGFRGLALRSKSSEASNCLYIYRQYGQCFGKQEQTTTQCMNFYPPTPQLVLQSPPMDSCLFWSMAVLDILVVYSTYI